MPYIHTRMLIGTFALITLILAVAAIARLFGLRLTEALYIGVLLVGGGLHIAYHIIGQRSRKR